MTGTGRIAAAFAAGGTGLVPYLTAGYPSLDHTLEFMRRLEHAGVRAIELGIPFSDPIADGAEIQRASEHAVRLGVGARAAIDVVRAFRAGGGRVPVVLMTYLNPVLALGAAEFARAAAAAGVDGVLVSDLPPDESPETWDAIAAAGLDTVVLVAPTTAEARLAALLARCTGFVYCLSRTGVTGSAGGEAGPVAERVRELRARTRLPVAVGFGISSPAQFAALRGVADAGIVGAAFMRAAGAGEAGSAGARVEALARELLAGA